MSDDRLPERVFANESPHAIHTRASENAHQQIVHNKSDLGPATLVVISLLALMIGVCGVIMGLNLSRQRELEDAFLKLDRQYRMTELKLDDWSVVAHRGGLSLEGDYTRGPQGNLDSESFKHRSK